MACPPEAQAKCAGTPAGDSWETSKADFFDPAASLLAAAPWAFARGNHEDCQRAWRGWLYYLDPRPLRETCEPFSKPYLVKLGAFQLVMFDSATASGDRELDPIGFRRYSSQLRRLKADHAWFVVHHPIWGLRPDAQPGLPTQETSSNVTKAWEKSPPRGIDIILAGHTHLFELLTFDRERPIQ